MGSHLYEAANQPLSNFKIVGVTRSARTDFREGLWAAMYDLEMGSGGEEESSPAPAPGPRTHTGTTSSDVGCLASRL